IAAIMELMNSLHKLDMQSAGARAVISEGLDAVVRMLSPITPHITQVLWEAFGHSGYVVDATCPAVDKSDLTRDSIEIVVQVNGKLRGIIEVAHDASKDSIEAAAKGAVAKHLEGVTLRKLIVVPGKLVSIVAN